MSFHVSATFLHPLNGIVTSPTIQQETIITMKQGNVQKSIQLTDQPQIIGTTPYYSRTLGSKERIVFDRGSIYSNISVFVSNNQSTNKMRCLTIEQNFGYNK